MSMTKAQNSVPVLAHQPSVDRECNCPHAYDPDQFDHQPGCETSTRDESGLREAEIVRLREALKPFAAIAEAVEHTDKRDGEVVHRQYHNGQHSELVKDDFRRARAALATNGGAS